MREIKFRAWFNGKGKMVYNLGFDDRSFITLDDPTLEEDEMPSVWDKDCIVDDSYYEGVFSYELMQYTGLKDKNGVEIYEGDILKGAMRNLIVAYKGAGFIAYWNDHDYGYGTEQMWCNLVEGGEVIGNIHDNPELLEDEK